MAAIITFSGKVDTLRKYVEWLEGKDEKYFNLTVSANDETDEYGNNVKVTVSQTEEQRKNKTKKSYLGNGRVIWKDEKGVIVAKPKDEMKTPAQEKFEEPIGGGQLPF